MKIAVCSLFMACLLFAGAAHALDDWAQVFPSSYPSRRSQHNMAYIGEDQVLLFGGAYTSFLGDSWFFDLGDTIWIQLSPASQPAARLTYAMAYIGGDQVLMFGGLTAAGKDDETWIFDLSDTAWTQLNPFTQPSARNMHAMAYIGQGQVFLFGGEDAAGKDDETWLFDLSDTTWTQLNPASQPSARSMHAMAYSGADQALLFGGYDTFEDDETWVFDLGDTTWTQLSSSSKPSVRQGSDMAYIGGDRVFLFGGRLPGAVRSDETWIFDLGETSWTLDANTTQPSARYDHRLSETSMDGSSFPILFGGGEASGYDDETWVFGGGDYLVSVELSPIGDAQPKTFQLFSNYPNPFNPDTWISYHLPQAGPVTIKIYNINGQLIDTLVDEEHTSGAYRVSWNGLALSGSPAASGVYFCQLRSGRSVETIKMILLR
jgi:hypothetical protein